MTYRTPGGQLPPPADGQSGEGTHVPAAAAGAPAIPLPACEAASIVSVAESAARYFEHVRTLGDRWPEAKRRHAAAVVGPHGGSRAARRHGIV